MVCCLLSVCLQYDEPMPPEHPDTLQPNVGWGLCRFYLLLASQLAIARQQLHQLILFHEHNLTNGRTQARDLRKAERGARLCGFVGGGDSLMSFALAWLLLAGMPSGGSTSCCHLVLPPRAAPRVVSASLPTRPHVHWCCAWCASCTVSPGVLGALTPRRVYVCL